MGIFIPENVALLSKFIQAANEHGISINCRGQAHSVYGQALCKNGVIVDLNHMKKNIELTDSVLIASAGNTWEEVVLFALKNGMMLPVLTDYLKLSIGGTLSLGGFGGSSYLYGSQADNVLDMNIISPQYGLISNAKKNCPDLFHATLCGLGQFGIITEVRLPLMPLKQHVKLFQLYYSNFKDFISDQKYLFKSKEFSHLKGFIIKKGNDWQYVIEAAIFLEKLNEPLIKSLLKISSYKIETKEISYIDFINNVTNYMNTLRKEQKLNMPHPWYSILLPEEAVIPHLELVLNNNPYLTGTGPIILYPINSNKLQQPFFIKPKCETIYTFSLLYNCSHEAVSNFPYKEVLKYNYFLYQQARLNGGCRYPFDAIPFDLNDWELHYQDKWFPFLNLKEKYDPNYILARDQIIMESRKKDWVSNLDI